MKKIALGLATLAVIIGLPSCTSVAPSGEQEAVLVEKPWIFGHGGIDMTPVTSGQEWTAWSTDAVMFTITPVTHTEKFENLMTKDRIPVDFTVYIKLQAIQGKTPHLLKGWGEHWYENSLAPSIRSMIRNKNSSYHMADLTSNRAILDSVEKILFTEISSYITSLIDTSSKMSMPVALLEVSIGPVTPPDDVLNETSKTAAQNQSKLTQDARAGSELSRKQAEVNKAIADKAYMTEMGMTIDQFLTMRSIDVEKEKVELVKGNPNATVILGQGTSIQPTMAVRTK